LIFEPRKSAISNQQSAISNQQSAISNQQSAIKEILVNINFPPETWGSLGL
jgi:hypothetical protein